MLAGVRWSLAFGGIRRDACRDGSVAAQTGTTRRLRRSACSGDEASGPSSSRCCRTCASSSQRMSSEQEQESRRRRWTPAAAQATLIERSSRRARRRSSPTASRTSTSARRRRITVSHPASGLVTALEPVMRACSGVWIAHGSGSADRETADAGTRPRAAGRRVVLVAPRLAQPKRRSRATTTASRTKGSGRSATSPTRGRSFAPRTGEHYRARQPAVRRRRVRGGRLRRPDRARAGLPLRAAPRLIRERLPRATIITFWHIPWPNAERFGICPWREELLEGMLGSEHPRLPHAAALQQLPRLGRPLSRGAHRSRAATRWCSSGRAHAGAPVPDLDRVADALGRDRCRPSPSAARRCSRSSGCRRTRCSASASIASTTPRASRSACSRSSGCSSAIPSCRGRFTFVQLAAPSRTQHRALPAAQRARRGAGGAHQRALRQRRLPARSSCCARTTSRRRCSALPRGRRLLREQPARRHEPGGQGVRRGARRRAAACWCSVSSPAPRAS